MLYSNCSEAVFRFHTVDPKEMQKILQYLADEINNNTDFDPHKNHAVPLYDKPEDYEGKGLLQCCAGLGDNDAVIEVNKKKKFFTLNIGNNDISNNETGWVDLIKAMNIEVEEAEFDKELREIARDCCCGIHYGFQDGGNL